MRYKVDLDEDGYLIAFAQTGTEEDIIEFDENAIDINHMYCYKLIDGELMLDEEKYQQELAKEKFYEGQISETSVINEYRIIKESNYNSLVTSYILLWVVVSLILLTKIFKMLKHKSKQE